KRGSLHTISLDPRERSRRELACILSWLLSRLSLLRVELSGRLRLRGESLLLGRDDGHKLSVLIDAILHARRVLIRKRLLTWKRLLAGELLSRKRLTRKLRLR